MSKAGSHVANTFTIIGPGVTDGIPRHRELLLEPSQGGIFSALVTLGEPDGAMTSPSTLTAHHDCKFWEVLDRVGS